MNNAAPKRFRVALSFAGEKRPYVAQIAAVLAQRFGQTAILYDKYHEAEFARRDLGFHLPALYHHDSALIVVIVCSDYASKEWCGLEWDGIFDLLKQRKNEDVMLCRFERATVRGLFSTAGFLDLDDKSPEQAAARILERLALNERTDNGHSFDSTEKRESAERRAASPFTSTNQSTNGLPSVEVEVLNFAAQLEEKRQNFIGRGWLFDKVWAWMDFGTESALLITGDPGIGKSAFVAEMIHRNPDGRILAYHLCRSDNPETLQASVFVQNLAGMIAKELPAFANLIAEDRYRHLFDQQAILVKPAHVFDQGLISALRQISPPPTNARCIVIDGLDEALTATTSELSIAALLSSRTEQFPQWCRIIATTRNDTEVLNRLSALRADRIEAHGQENLDDVDAFISSRLASPQFQALFSSGTISLETVKAKLRLSADGNFLYASQALKDIERGRYSFSRLDELPDGIHGIYLSFFERSFPSTASFSKCRQLLEVVLAAQQPIPTGELAEVAGLQSEYELSEILGQLSMFIRCTAEGVRLYHKSLADWLTSADPVSRHRFHVSVRAGHVRLARAFDGYLLPRPTVAPDAPDVEDPSGRTAAEILDNDADTQYALTHLPLHLRAAGRRDDLLILLSSYPYVAARVQEGQIHGLIKDIQLARCEFDHTSGPAEFLSLLEQALRRESNFLQRTRRFYRQATFQTVVNLLSFELAGTGGLSQDCLKLVQDLVENWREAFDYRLSWIRALRPPDLALGVDQCAVLTEHHAEARHLALSADETLLLSCGDDGVARLHQTSSSEVLHSWRLGFKVVGGCFVDSERQVIAVGSNDHDAAVYRWDVRSGRTLASVAIRGTRVRCCAPISNSTAILIGTDKGVYLIATESVSGAEELSDADRIAADFDPDKVATGRFTTSIAFANKKEIRIYDTATRLWTRSFQVADKHDVSAVAVSPNGDRLAMATWSGWPHHVSVRIFSLESGVQLEQIVHSGDHWPNSVAFSYSQAFLASGTNDGKVRLWDWESLRLEREYDGHESYVVALCVSQDDERIYSGGTDGRVLSWNTDRLIKPASRIGHDGTIYSLSVSDDDRYVASGCEAGQLYVWDWTSGDIVFSAECFHSVSGIAFSPDGLHLATLGSEDGNMQLWNIKRRRELWHRRGQPYGGPRGGRKRVHEPVNSVAFSPRGESIACIEGAYNESSALVLRSVSDGTERGRIEGGTEKFTEVAMSAGARSIAVGTAAGAIQVWAISKEWKQRAVLEGITSAISALAFHPHQQAIVAASDDGEVAMWRLERRRWERLWYRHTLESTERIAFSNTGSNVALIRYYSNSVSVFDSESGKTIAEEDGISSPWHLYQRTGDSFVVTSSEDEMSVRSTARGEIIGILPVGLKRFTQSRDGRLIAGTKGRQLHLYRLELPNGDDHR